jgi:hypothetical protein
MIDPLFCSIHGAGRHFCCNAVCGMPVFMYDEKSPDPDSACRRLRDTVVSRQRRDRAMNHFKLVSVGSPSRVIAFDAASVTTVLDLVHRRRLGDTDVYQDGLYKFSVSYSSDGSWTLTQSRVAPDCVTKPAARKSVAAGPLAGDVASSAPTEAAVHG